MIYIASDHGGFALKEEIKKFLSDRQIDFSDLGPVDFDQADDYPDFAGPVAAKISAHPSADTGILLCRSGQGVNIVANKFPGVRAALVWNEKEAVASRTDDLANVLSLPTDYISTIEAKNIVEIFLQTPMGTEDRHVRRVKKIGEIENKLLKP